MKTVHIPLVRGVTRIFATLILSRLWYLVLAAVAAACLGGLLLSQERLRRDHASFVRDGLLRDQFELETVLKLDAKARLDALAPLGLDDNVVSWLRKMNGRSDLKRVEERAAGKVGLGLASFNQKLGGLRADKIWVLDSRGIVVATSESGSAFLGSHFGMMVLIKKALAGYLKDDAWMLSGTPYRVAGRPVIASGQYLGALVHLKQLDAEFAKAISDQIGGAGVGFSLDDRFIVGIQGGHKFSDSAEQKIAGMLKTHSQEPTWGPKIDDAGFGVLAARMATTLKEVDLRFVLVRPLASFGSVFSVLTGSTRSDFSRIAWWWVLLLALVAAGVGLWVLWAEHDRLYDRFAAQVQSVVQGQAERIQTESLGMDYGGMGDALNGLILRLKGNEQDRRSTEDILSMADQISASNESSYFGFGAKSPKTTAPIPSIQNPNAPPPLPQNKPVRALSEIDPVRTVPTRYSSQLSIQPNTTVSSYPEEPHANDSANASQLISDATTVSEMPSEDDMRHFESVYEAYLALSREVGQNVDALTFEKFLVSIEKTRRSVLQKPGIRNVRFAVHMKDGKPTLRATPIRN